ncbi:glycosyltransferase [Jannaschia sp. LMIT008]|uniref:glycosyltransferase n=1 Tax=Jannaschia maritima TaxID=3032585 RepID=UPI00281125B1|nr:glycosyltransferase [Jannaschia sp. LMIT008]
MTRKPHLAIFLPSLRGGGAERVMVTVANGMVDRGYRVDVLLTKAEGPYLQDVDRTIEIVDFDRTRVLSSFLPLVRYLRREKPDAMLSAMSHVNVVAALARTASRTSTRLVVSERNDVKQIEGRSPIGLAMRTTYPSADHVVAVSEGIARDLRRLLHLPDGKVSHIPNPVDVERIRRQGQARPEHPWFADAAGPIVVATGRLEAQKDYPTLLKAFASMRGKRGVRLAILGRGSREGDLRRQASDLGIADRVHFAGFQKNPYAWMTHSALFVMSSRHEGFPNALLEAMACGTPVVSTDCPTGPHEILDGGRWGALVPVGDPEALADAMCQTLDDPGPPDVLGRSRIFDPRSITLSYARALGLEA